MKKDYKELRKGWRTLKAAFKWLFLIILLFLLLSLLTDFLDHYHLLIKKVTEQNQYIDTLQGTIQDLKETNSHLLNQLHIEHSKVEQLQQELSIKINGQPVIMTVDDIKEEIEPDLKLPDPTIPATIIGIMSLLKHTVFRFAF